MVARKVALRASIFNFEAVYQRYRVRFNETQKSSQATLLQVSRQTFLKIFLDLVNQGYLRSESQTDILSVNNRVSLGFRAKDFDKMVEKNKHLMDLPTQLIDWS